MPIFDACEASLSARVLIFALMLVIKDGRALAQRV